MFLRMYEQINQMECKMAQDRIKALQALAEEHERIEESVRDAIRGPDIMSIQDHGRAAKTIRAALAANWPLAVQGGL